jgi:hypothetical protein
MGLDLHRPQPHQARPSHVSRPGKSLGAMQASLAPRMQFVVVAFAFHSRIDLVSLPPNTAIWTGS